MSCISPGFRSSVLAVGLSFTALIANSAKADALDGVSKTLTVTDCNGNVRLMEAAAGSDSLAVVAAVKESSGAAAQDGSVSVELVSGSAAEDRSTAKIVNGEAYLGNLPGSTTWKVCAERSSQTISSIAVQKKDTLSSAGVFGGLVALAGGVVGVAMANDGGSSSGASAVSSGGSTSVGSSVIGTSGSATAVVPAAKPAADCPTCLAAAAEDCLNDETPAPVSPFN